MEKYLCTNIQNFSTHRTGKWANDCMSTSASCSNHCWSKLELMNTYDYCRIIWPRNEGKWWLFTEARCYWVLMGFLPAWKRHEGSADQSESEKKVVCCLHLVFLHNFLAVVRTDLTHRCESKVKCWWVVGFEGHNLLRFTSDWESFPIFLSPVISNHLSTVGCLIKAQNSLNFKLEIIPCAKRDKPVSLLRWHWSLNSSLRSDNKDKRPSSSQVRDRYKWEVIYL